MRTMRGEREKRLRGRNRLKYCSRNNEMQLMREVEREGEEEEEEEETENGRKEDV